jgi:hypothetical protein
MARDAVMGATPASMATSRSVIAPLLRRERLGVSLSFMNFSCVFDYGTAIIAFVKALYSAE